MAQPSIASGSLPMRRVTQALLLASLICSLFPSSFAQTVRDYRANPRFGTAISDAKLLAENQEYELAIASYQEANEIAHGKDKPCLRALIDVQITSGHYDEAIATARAFRAIATTPAEKSYAEATRGRVLFVQAEPDSGTHYDPTLLNKADAAFKSALTLDPRNSTALLLDGEVLVHLGQIESARTEFKACLASITPDDPSYGRTRRFAEHPDLALRDGSARHDLSPTRTLHDRRFPHS